MRVSREEMDKSHARIVEGASRLLRERGVESTSVADVMSEAGLTHGGFYRHFPDKEALLAAATDKAFDDMAAALDARFAKYGREGAVADYHADYLSNMHVDQPGKGCPIAALGGDVSRASASLKSAFGGGVRKIIAKLAEGGRGSAEARRSKAARRLAMLVGAVVIARASDAETARQVLEACQSDGIAQ